MLIGIALVYLDHPLLSLALDLIASCLLLRERITEQIYCFEQLIGFPARKTIQAIILCKSLLLLIS